MHMGTEDTWALAELAKVGGLYLYLGTFAFVPWFVTGPLWAG